MVLCVGVCVVCFSAAAEMLIYLSIDVAGAFDVLLSPLYPQ